MPDGRYLTVDAWKEWARDQVAVDDYVVGAAILAAQQQLDNACGRRFEIADVSSERVFIPPARSPILYIDDCTTITSIVDNDVDVAATDYQPEPLNNLSIAGETVPFDRVRRHGGYWYRYNNEATITIDATWGWAAIPFQIVEACKIVTKATLEVRDARFGLAAILESGIGISPREVTAVKQAIVDYRSLRLWSIG